MKDFLSLAGVLIIGIIYVIAILKMKNNIENGEEI